MRATEIPHAWICTRMIPNPKRLALAATTAHGAPERRPRRWLLRNESSMYGLPIAQVFSNRFLALLVAWVAVQLQRRIYGVHPQEVCCRMCQRRFDVR